MKTFLIFTATSLLIITTLQAQTVKQITEAKKQQEVAKNNNVIVPPITVRAAFSKDHPGANVNWKKERGHFEANYSEKGKSMSTLYGESGHKIESETIIPQSQMPQSVMAYINSHYKGETIKETSIIRKSNGEENYEVEIKGMDILFTKEGKYIRSLKD